MRHRTSHAHETSSPWRHHRPSRPRPRRLRHLFLSSSNLACLQDGRQDVRGGVEGKGDGEGEVRVVRGLTGAVTPTYVTDCDCRCHFDFVLCANLAMCLLLSCPVGVQVLWSFGPISALSLQVSCLFLFSSPNCRVTLHLAAAKNVARLDLHIIYKHFRTSSSPFSSMLL